MLMQRINLVCGQDSNQPAADDSALITALERRQSVLDMRLKDLSDAKRVLGMDAEHARKLDGLIAGWADVEASLDAERAALASGAPAGTAQACPSEASVANGNGDSNDCDKLSPIHDGMIDMIQLAFAWDLTRVVAFTLSGASSGHRWPSAGINSAHHTLEHSGDADGMNTMTEYFAGKYARLIEALKDVDDGNGETALYNSSVILGMECWSDGGHYLDDIPFMFAGQGGGRFQTGRIIDAAGRNNNDLLVSAQNAAGIDSDVYGLASLCEGPII
jgi:hypothetical protein